MVLGFGFYFSFYAALIIFLFSGVLIFWNFLYFLAFFDFFCNFFSGLLLCFYSPKWVQFLKFSCNSFFSDYTSRRGGGDAQNVTAQSFAALGLVFNRICKSIKKYKTVMLGVFQGVNVYGLHDYFLRFYQFGPYGITYVTYHL